jgi:uncharacterized repeat protein (TIGR01451 family)
MRDGKGLNRATFRLLALVVSLGIVLAGPLASLTALAAPGATVGVSDAATAEGGPPLGALGAPESLGGDSALGRVVEASALDAVLDQASADVSLVKTAPATVTVGSNLVYTLTVANAGPSPATNVTVTDLLLTGLTFVSATTTQGTCALAGQLVTCTIGTMAVGATNTVTITTTPQASLAGSTVTNSATVSASEPDPNPGNNTGFATTTIQGTGTATPTAQPTTPADLSLTKTAPATASVGPNFTYTLTVANAGPGVATGVTATDLLLTGLTFVSATSTQGTCAAAGQLVTCTIGVMNIGGSVTIQITVTPQASLAGATVTNTATVTGAQPDPNPGNNTGTASTTIAGTGTAVPTGVPTNSADMSLTKVGAPNPVNVGSNLTYTYTIVNNGPGVATGVVMSDFVQAGLTFVSATATQGTCTLSNNVLTCNVGTMNPGAVVTVTNVVQPQASLAGSTITNTASVAAQQPDPNPANNTATATVQVAGAGTVVAATQTVVAATQTAIAATQTATGTGPVVPPGINPPALSGQTGAGCVTRPGAVCTVTGAVTGTIIGGTAPTFNLTATGPTNTAPRGVPAVFIPTTIGIESFGCTPVPSAIPLSTVCTGTTRGVPLLNGTITVRFPLIGGGTQDVVGTITGQGGQAQNVQQAIASVPPSGLQGLPCADTIGQTCQSVGPVQGLGAVTASMTWNLTANVPGGVAAGTVPVVVFTTTVGLEGFPCAAVAAGATTVACAVTTVGNALLASNVTVVFAPGVTAIGTVQGPGPLGLQALASAPPPPLLPPPPPLLPPFMGPPPLLPPPPQPPGALAVQPGGLLLQPSAPGVPVVPEADSLFLLAGGLLAVGALAARRTLGKRR